MSEPIPSAIARGPDAATPGAISPIRTGIVAGILAAIFVVATYIVSPVPDRALSIVGGDASDFGRHGGMRIVWVPPAGTDLAQVERALLAGHRGGRISRNEGVIVMEVGGVPPEEVQRAAKLLTSGGLTFHRCVITEAMPRLAQAHGFEIGEEATQRVHLEIDQWMPEDGGARQSDFFLIGDSPEQIEAALASARANGWTLPDGTHLAFEYVEGWNGNAPFYRSYVIETTPAITGAHVAEAVASYDPNTNRPVVLLDFDREGTQIFGDVTASMVGQKLATVLGGDIVSAPIINGPIRGGRASITMGGADVNKQEREQQTLVGVLKAGAMPSGGTLREATYTPASVTATQEWLARLLAGLVAAFVIGLGAWALVRKARPVWRTPEVRVPGSVPWVRLGTLLLAPLSVLGASWVTAPGLDTEQIIYIVGDTAPFSLGMLGITPLLASYLLVELVATIVPSWRRRRHAGPAARVPFDIAIIATAVVIALLQAWFVAAYLDKYDAVSPGFGRLLFLGSMVAATLGFALVAWLVRVYGAGNGYVAFLVTGFVLRVYDQLSGDRVGAFTPQASTGDIVIALISSAVFALVVGIVLRWRISHAGQAPLRVPTSGFAPIAGAQGLLSFVIVALGMIPLGAMALYEANVWLFDLHRGISIALIIVLAVVWSWTFARPTVLAPFAERAKLAAPSQEAWRAATLLTLGLVTALVSSYVLLGEFSSRSMLGTLPAALLAAFVLDAYDDLRGRRGRLAYVWSLQSPQHADIAAHALGAESIGFHMSGVNVRTLLAWFGPFAPIDVWVQREDVVRTREVLAKVFAAK